MKTRKNRLRGVQLDNISKIGMFWKQYLEQRCDPKDMVFKDLTQ